MAFDYTKLIGAIGSGQKDDSDAQNAELQRMMGDIGVAMDGQNNQFQNAYARGRAQMVAGPAGNPTAAPAAAPMAPPALAVPSASPQGGFLTQGQPDPAVLAQMYGGHETPHVDLTRKAYGY